MKKIKVINLSGYRGILLVTYAIICAAAGFILFPAWAIMALWNYIGTYIYGLPHMSIIHGFMLYAVLILLYFATSQNKPLLGLSSNNLSQAQIAALMKEFEDKK